MKIKDFCEKYNKIVTQSLKDKFLQDNLEIKQYIPFITKDILATNLVNQTSYVYETYIDETTGEEKRRKTDKIKLNSTAQYLLFCRLVIENYTNLEKETAGFFEEYDALKQCGLLDKLMGENSILPMDDIAELKTIIDMHQKDVVFNESTTQAFIGKQIDKIKQIGEIAVKPYMKQIGDKLSEIPKEDLDKIVEFAKNGGFTEV